jgi:hypothetical protein
MRLSPMVFGHKQSIIPAPDNREVEHLVEWELAGKTKVLGENLKQNHFVHNKPHVDWPWIELKPRWWETDDWAMALSDKYWETLFCCGSQYCCHKSNTIVTARGWTAEESGFKSQQVWEIFIFSITSIPARGGTQSPVQWVPGVVILGIE